VEQFRLRRPDVVLMDYDLPDQNGVQTVSIIRNEFLDARVLMLTILDGEEDIYRAVSAGARGYLTKSCECEEVLDAIRTIAGGKGYFPAAINAKLKAREKRKPLTERDGDPPSARPRPEHERDRGSHEAEHGHHPPAHQHHFGEAGCL
jgi:DNA-binding NarL/FixJ family response regulator